MSRRRRSAQNDSSPSYQAKRRELLQTAADVFQEKGYDAATLHDIAERFGTDRASIYYYFASKKELFQALFHDVVSGVLDENLRAAAEIAEIDIAAPEKLRRLVELQMLSYENNYPYVYLYIQEDMAKLEFQSTPWAKDMLRKTKRFEAIVSGVLEQGVAEGTFRDDVPTALMAKALFGMINWTHRWLKPGPRRVDAKQTIDAFCTLFFQGALIKRG
ncbi:TetR/AcrR family transcriptional regulator [Rhodococcus opacus]|nr:TetR/AcrR family transcriptional regulator [Rhodococcus opacus]RZL82814.1 MAG: TetR/AcrR family transcriptional regulator [Rhodococcus sp. (in: high G+C Gram-positive bacteria)]